MTYRFTNKEKIERAGQALLEIVIGFSVLVTLISLSGTLFYDQFKKINQDRVQFEKSHREMIQRRNIHESLRF